MANLTLEDLEIMTIGEALDYIENYVEVRSGKKSESIRKATQEDFDQF